MKQLASGRMRVAIGARGSIWWRVWRWMTDPAPPWVLCSRCHNAVDRDRARRDSARSCSRYTVCNGQHEARAGWPAGCNTAHYVWG